MTPEQIKKEYENHEAHKASNIEFRRQMDKFGIAPTRAEGQIVDYGMPDGYAPKEPEVDTTWIEFPLPKAWAEECEAMIGKWLEDKTATTGLKWE